MTTEKINVLQKASLVAQAAHADQKRKYTGEPYFNHCHAVASLVYSMTRNEYMAAAAFLHDVVEDTAVTIEEINLLFGKEIAEMVYDLTDQFTPEAYPKLNRQKRKKLEADRLGKCDPKVKLIKLCDLQDNTKDIEQHDDGFARIYLKEKAYLVKAMGY